MIPNIGLMVGVYILARCLAMVMRRGEREEPASVKVMALVAMLVTVLVMAGLIIGGPRQP